MNESDASLLIKETTKRIVQLKEWELSPDEIEFQLSMDMLPDTFPERYFKIHGWKYLRKIKRESILCNIEKTRT